MDCPDAQTGGHPPFRIKISNAGSTDTGDKSMDTNIEAGHPTLNAYSLRPLKSVLPILLESQTISMFDQVFAKIYQCLRNQIGI